MVSTVWLRSTNNWDGVDLIQISIFSHILVTFQYNHSDTMVEISEQWPLFLSDCSPGSNSVEKMGKHTHDRIFLFSVPTGFLVQALFSSRSSVLSNTGMKIQQNQSQFNVYLACVALLHKRSFCTRDSEKNE